VLLEENKPDEALPLLKQVVREKPEYAEAHYSLGKLMLQRGELGTAITELEAAAKQGPSKTYSHYQLGRAYAKAGRQDDARREFQTVKELEAHPVANRPGSPAVPE
jgi:lipopolysaccharide biosynthesis regulator YciM